MKGSQRGMGHLGAILVVALLVTGLVLSSAGLAVDAGTGGIDSISPPGRPSLKVPASATGPTAIGAEALEPASHVTYLSLVYHSSNAHRLRPFGVQLYEVTPPTTDRAARAGAGWVRIPLPWAAIEPENTTPDHYDWPAEWETELASYARRGVGVILTLTGNPEWAAAFPGGPVDEEDVGELVEFLQAAVARYGATPYCVKHWEMYNEVDNGDPGYALAGWGYFGNDPQAYVDLLELVYQPIKDMDPQAQVLFGGIAYDYWVPEGPFVQAFLDDVLAIMDGNDNYPFDMMNFHYYPAFRDNWEAYGIDIIGKAEFIRAKMVAYGAEKPLICTEAGLWSDCRDPDDEVICSSYEEQSRYVPQLYARGEAAGLEINIWFMLVDPENPWEFQHGLVYENENLDPKPSYGAYQTLAEQLTSADYVRTLDASETGSGEIEAYEFAGEGSERIIVAWTNDHTSHTLALAGGCLTVVGKYGAESGPICDGADGVVDGVIHVAIGPSPAYLHLP